MIASLEDAWKWYEGVRSLTELIGRLGRKYWESLPWDGPMGRDNRLQHVAATQVTEGATIDFIRNNNFVRFSVAVYVSAPEGCEGHKLLPWLNPTSPPLCSAARP